MSQLPALAWRAASLDDVRVLAALNHQLIQDEGHHNAMSRTELEARMRAWLEGEYQAALFSEQDEVVVYALHRSDEWNRCHLRQFFVARASRRRGIGRAAMELFRKEVVPDATSLILEVLCTNDVGRAFWAACGFREYAVTLLLDSPS